MLYLETLTTMVFPMSLLDNQSNDMTALSDVDLKDVFLSQQEEFIKKRKQYKKDLEEFIRKKLKEYNELTVPEIERRAAESPTNPEDRFFRDLDMKEMVLGAAKTLVVVEVGFFMFTNRNLVFLEGSVDGLPYDRVLSTEEVYCALKRISLPGAVNVLGKLRCRYEEIERLQGLFSDNDKQGFIAALDSVSCDKSFLYFACSRLIQVNSSSHPVWDTDDDVVDLSERIYDYYIARIRNSSETDERKNRYYAFLERFKQVAIQFEKAQSEAAQNHNQELEKEIKETLCKAVGDMVAVSKDCIDSCLEDSFSFEERLLSGLVNSLDIQPFFEKYGVYVESVPSLSPNGDLRLYRFYCPKDLFNGAVDTNHDYIPGLKNNLKDVAVFEPLFNYILRLGGIRSDEEAGALLRVFTGYPVENANEKARWGTDYHILYYLVKHMFAAKGAYAKMMECIDITYPSEAERKKAEKAPSSYADRISGSDASSILETLSRLSKVF